MNVEREEYIVNAFQREKSAAGRFLKAVAVEGRPGVAFLKISRESRQSRYLF